MAGHLIQVTSREQNQNIWFWSSARPVGGFWDVEVSTPALGLSLLQVELCVSGPHTGPLMMNLQRMQVRSDPQTLNVSFSKSGRGSIVCDSLKEKQEMTKARQTSEKSLNHPLEEAVRFCFFSQRSEGQSSSQEAARFWCWFCPSGLTEAVPARGFGLFHSFMI